MQETVRCVPLEYKMNLETTVGCKWSIRYRKWSIKDFAFPQLLRMKIETTVGRQGHYMDSDVPLLRVNIAQFKVL